MKKLRNIHPGEVLQEEFLTPMNITAYRLSKQTLISQTSISEILKGNRRYSASIQFIFRDERYILAGITGRLRYRRGKKELPVRN